MNSKDKAIELVNQYYEILQSEIYCTIKYSTQKQCAIYAVDEIINSKPIGNSLEYWNEVKKEIGLL